MTSNASNKGNHPLIARLEAIVLEHLDAADFDVETFADLSGLSRSELYRKIKKHTGKSVTEFVRDIRLHKSLEYLKDEERTASEVAYLVGFSSATYFNKCFKDKFGFTPGEASFHEEKIKELIDITEKESKKSGSKFFISKRGLIAISLVGIVVLGWYFIQASNFTDPESVEGVKGLSIAVLPIINETENQESETIGYYATWEIISSLNEIDSVARVPPMRTVGKYKDSLNIPTAEIIRRMKVEYILQGYLKGNDTSGYKIFFELLDAEDNLLWNHMFEYEGDNADKMYKEYSRTANLVAKELGKDISGIPDPVNKTGNSLAMKYFSEGLFEANNYTRDGWKKGVALIEKAIEKDPEFVDAYLELADLWLYAGMNWSYASEQEGWGKAKALYNKILEIKTNSIDGRIGLANGIFYYELNVLDTVPEFFGIPYDEWIVMRPDHAEKTGRHKISLESNLNFQNRDPANSTVHAIIALNYYFLNRPEEAIRKLDENYETHKNDFNFLREASKAYYFLGEDQKMQEAVLYFYDTFSERPPILRWLRAIVADKNKDQATVDLELQYLLESYQNRESGSPAWFLALFHAYKNDVDKTLDWLEKSYEAREVEMTWLAQEPDLHIVGDQPRYRALLDSMNFPESARRHVIFKD
ncbi:helix-turn-helix domain-containing protein [Robertkochia marina]|uniref:Helix-turn-helix domain-containing protein n=1 Tax=Robertkochia marina TaxID=1227945 RepID=A0A4S3M0D9_9FLAO|nr:helix-turn-helix domain-containing protein [Robertkochia marina]THD67854.1 helix-turn-helix domain-containing protein [Robertkochia marina]TRZ42107.1 helix-turn-helix domain-containing protein [Robertkochia marina]